MHILGKEQLLELLCVRRERLDAASRSNPFLHSAWLLHWIEHVADPQWTFVVPESLFNGHSFLLLYRVGDGPLRALTDHNAAQFSPLISTARNKPAAMCELLAQLRRFGVVQLAPLTLQDAKLVEEAADGWYVKRYICPGNWTQPCAGLSYDSYLAQ
jgi:hypothetical protein